MLNKRDFIYIINQVQRGIYIQEGEEHMSKRKSSQKLIRRYSLLSRYNRRFRLKTLFVECTFQLWRI